MIKAWFINNKEIINVFLAVWWGITAIGCAKEPQQASHVKASLISEVETTQPGQPFWAGIHLKMDQGWHTYWKNPGDSGMATSVQWELPRGFSAGPLQWPEPEKFTDSAGTTYGYKNQVLLPVQIIPPKHLQEGQKITLEANVRWLECNDVCIPGNAKLTLVLICQAGQAKINQDYAGFFAETRQKIPAN